MKSLNSYPKDLFDKVRNRWEILKEKHEKEVEDWNNNSSCMPIMRDKIMKQLRDEGVPAFIRPANVPSYFDMLLHGCRERHVTEALMELKELGFKVKVDEDWLNDYMDRAPVLYRIEK